MQNTLSRHAIATCHSVTTVSAWTFAAQLAALSASVNSEWLDIVPWAGSRRLAKEWRTWQAFATREPSVLDKNAHQFQNMSVRRKLDGIIDFTFSATTRRFHSSATVSSHSRCKTRKRGIGLGPLPSSGRVSSLRRRRLALSTLSELAAF